MHHTYTNGRATDVSGRGNHGVPTATAAGTGENASALFFNGGTSRVDVRPSADFAELRGLRVRVRVKTRAVPWWWDLIAPRWWGRWEWWWRRSRLRAWRPRRQNLVEGHLSFALFVEPDGGVRGTILDGNGVWRGPVTPGGVIRPGQWHTVEFGHDGIVSAAIAVDGVTLAAAHDLIGPVRGVGPRGVTIGHWPEDPHVYTLRGWIDEAEVWRDEPVPEEVAADECCGSPEVVDDAVDELREEGWDEGRVRALVARLDRFEADLRVAVTGGDPVRVAHVNGLAARGMGAVARGDRQEAIAALGGTLQLLAALPAAQQQAFTTRATDLVADLPFSDRLVKAMGDDLGARSWLSDLASALCVPVPPGVKPPGRDRAEPIPVRLGEPGTDARPEGAPGDPHGALLDDKPADDQGREGGS